MVAGVGKTVAMARYQHGRIEGDPHVVPIREAATIMILRDAPSFEVLMVQRASRAAFGASAWVFPGGRVDPEDGAVGESIVGRTDTEASALLDLPSGGLAWWVAAVRETIEEAGLLLFDHDGDLGDGPSPDAIRHVRAAVQHDSGALFPSLREAGMQLDVSGIHEVARFITPLGPPRRFDTRFFVVAAPDDQDISPDHEEVVAAQWISPTSALDLWQSDDFPLMSVTHRMLACLRRYDSVADVLEAAAARPPTRRVRVNDPDGEYHVLLPEDPGYADAELEIEHGWVRL